MNSAHPSQTVIWRAFVWPAILALSVMAVMIVERLQVDWTLACSLDAANPKPCNDDTFNIFFAWTPAAFVFGLAHIVGAASLYGGVSSPAAVWERLARLAAYFAIHVFPVFGWYFFYVGLAAGYLVSITVIGLIVAFPIGAMAAGFVAGLLLALAAGPSLQSAHRVGWKRLLVYYGSGSALGTLILVAGQGLFDPAFGHLAGPEHPWLTAAAALSAVALSCLCVSVSALKANYPSIWLVVNSGLKSAFATIGSVAAILVLPVHFMVRNGSTVFPHDAGLVAPVASFIRGNKPPVAANLSLAGMRYMGPRSAILERDVISRDRQETITLHKGTDKEVNWSSTIHDPYLLWRIRAPDTPERESLYVIADNGGVQKPLHCKPALHDRQLCLSSPNPPIPPDVTELTRALAEDGEDGYEFSNISQNAVLGIRYDVRTQVEGSSAETWGRIYCRLNLVNVTSAEFSVHQVIPCNADWIAEEKQVRSYVEGLFVPGDATSSRSETK